MSYELHKHWEIPFQENKTLSHIILIFSDVDMCKYNHTYILVCTNKFNPNFLSMKHSAF